MAKNTEKKVSIASVDALLKEVDVTPVVVQITVGDKTLDVEVKPYLSIEEFCLMVDTAASCQFVDDENGEPAYVAALERYAKNSALLAFMTNIKPETASEKLNKLCNQTDIINKISDVIDVEYLWDFYEAVDKQIEYRKTQLLSTERSKLAQLTTQMEKAVDAFTKLNERFSDIDGAKVVSMMDKIANMNEAELAKSVVDARDKDFVEQRRNVVEFQDAKH